MTTPIGAVTTTPGGTPIVDQGNPGALLDRDAFLKLLVAQLKYQDPTNPADTSQLVTQSAQLTMVDRLNEMASSFQTSNSLSRMALASSMVGKVVSFLDPQGTAAFGVVDGISIDGDVMTLAIGGRAVPLERVGAVLPAPPPAPIPAPAETAA